jgi:hypothetical protein
MLKSLDSIWIKPAIYSTRDEHTKHYTTEAWIRKIGAPNLNYLRPQILKEIKHVKTIYDGF